MQISFVLTASLRGKQMFDLSAYVHVPSCEEAVNSSQAFNTFKSDSRFTTILEHTAIDNSHQFMNQIISTYTDYAKLIDWKLVKQNDLLGSAHIIEYPQLESVVALDDYLFSPSTVAYVFKALDILNHIQQSKLNSVDILEIGAGYGGQCKMIMDMANLFNVKINSYTLVDLYWPNMLQKKYLEELGYSEKIKFISYESLLDGDTLPDFNYLISIYALGEFLQDVQQFYVDKMVNFPNYYLVWNTPKIHEKFLLSGIEEEKPRTGPYNVLIKSRVV